MMVNINSRVQKTLTRLHREANRAILTIARGLAKDIFCPLQPKDLKDTYIPLAQSVPPPLSLASVSDAPHIVRKSLQSSHLSA